MSRLGVSVCWLNRILLPGTNKSNSERDSPRDQLVVTLFLLTVCGLLLGAGIKNRMLKAGLNGTTVFPWSRQRQEDVRWWEVSGVRTPISDAVR